VSAVRGILRGLLASLAFLGIVRAQSSAEFWPVGVGGATGTEAADTATDADGNVYLVGTFRDTADFASQQLFSAGDNDVYVAKYDPFGSLIWVVSAGGGQADEVGGVAIDDSKNVYVTGAYRGSASFGGFPLANGGNSGDVFVAKLDNNGNWKWAVRAGAAGIDAGRAVMINHLGLFVAGACSQSAGFMGLPNLACPSPGPGGFVAKLDKDGVWQWARAIGSSGSEVSAMAVDASGRLYATGPFMAPMTVSLPGSNPSQVTLVPDTAPDSFIAKLSASGADPSFAWATAAPGAVSIHALVVDRFANLHVAGETKEAVSFSPSVAIGEDDIGAFVARMHDSGSGFQWQWAKGAEGGVARDVTMDPSGDLLVTGTFGTSNLGVQGIGVTADNAAQDLLMGLGSLGQIALDLMGGKMYWVEAGSIRAANLNGTGAVPIASGQNPGDIAVDPAAGKVYWTVPSSNLIRRSNLDGSAIQLVRSASTPRDIAVHSAAGKIYWSDNSGAIFRGNVDNTGMNELVVTGIVNSSAITLDLIGGKIYFTDENIEGTDEIWRASLGGTGQELVASGTGVNSPRNLAVDAAGGHLYWSSADRLKRANLDGTQVVDVIDAQHDLVGVALDLAGARAYWTIAGVFEGAFQQKIQRGSLAAGVRLRGPFGFAFGPDGDLYVGNNNSSQLGIVRYEGLSGDFEFLEPFVEIADEQQQRLRDPRDLAFGPNGSLYVCSQDNVNGDPGDRDYVVVYHGQTGAELGTIPSTFNDRMMNDPEYLAFSPQGHLYVSERLHGVRRWAANGVQCGGSGQLACPNGGGLSNAKGLTFGPSGLLYVSSHDTDEVLRYHTVTGQFLGVFVAAGSGPLHGPTDLTFGPDGHLYVASDITNEVLRFSGQNGAFLDVYIPSDAGIVSPRDIEFGPDGALYVADAAPFVDRVHRFAFAEHVGTMTLGSTTLIPQGDRDAFVAKLRGGSAAAQVDWLWATSGGGTLQDAGRSIVAASASVYYVAGDFRGEAAFGELSIQAAGSPNAFLARLECDGEWARFHTWTIGEAVPRPSCASAEIPEIEIPGRSLSEAFEYFYWNPAENALYAVRPAPSAFIRWRLLGATLQDAARIVQAGEMVWPEDPQIHVAGAPVQLEPGGTAAQAGAAVTYTAMLYSESGATDTQRIFSAFTPGFSVLLYSDGLEVVRTVMGNDPLYRVDATAIIGTELTDSDHDDPSGKTGFVLSPTDPEAEPRSAYDGVGHERAYDRQNRTGPIIAVNTNDHAAEDLVVAWYRPNTKGVAWPVKPVRYEPRWPTEPRRIIIASELGSEIGDQPVLDPASFPLMRVYRQPDRSLPGFNPNDEHALFAPANSSSGFNALFALRGDLSASSGPYVLLKYWEAKAQQWAFVVYRVDATGLGFDSLTYLGTAGQLVNPPYPLRLLGPCPETTTDVSEPFWQDYRGAVWARSAGAMRVRYFYPLRVDFDYDLDGDGSPDAEAGACVPWLHLLGGTPGEPFPVDYTIGWPDNVPVLQVGETLLTPKRGLPDILHQAAAEVVFDELDPDSEDPNVSLAQVIDPLSPRSVELNALPDDVAAMNRQGMQLIVGNTAGTIKLPFGLRSRLTYDPLNKTLSFKGLLDESGAGEPLLMLNVLSSRERDMLMSLSNDEAYQAAVDDLYDLTRNPRNLSLDGQTGPDQALLIGLQDLEPVDEAGMPAPDGTPEPFRVLGVPGALTAGFAAGTGYLTLAFNNHPSLNPLPVSLNVIRVDCGPYQGEIKVIESDNVFDDQLTLRHSGDFGGDPSLLEFQWFSHPDVNGQPPAPPPDPDIGALGGWTDMGLETGESPTPGLVEVTLEGANLRTLSDNWYFVRYKGYSACGNQLAYSALAGAPGGTPLAPSAQLGEGWIKRVVRGLDPFDARVRDFHASPTNTYSSMLVQLGERYEGDIAFNGDPNNLNQIGLIETYETVLRRGLSLTTRSTPPVDYAPANNQLLLVTSRVADFYTLLGNEAFADAADPTIALGTDSDLGSLAPAIFPFQNQLPSLIEEELVLLRGRDSTGAPTSARPVYNRLFWNFTSGDGEVAYSQAYNVTDQNSNGFINETDARIMFPQGHGDAWGHYLTALTGYYGLLRDPYFTWIPRAESVLVSGVPVLVDFLDERKFAAAAAAKAKAGAEIVDLTYRKNYTEDPTGQWQGYQDTNADRAWGVDDWARRAGQGAYFDWLVANAIVPAVDPDFDPATHHPIQKVDRTTVHELAEIASEFSEIQTQLDEADRGLNPLGLAKGVVPFDIDPSQIDEGMTHFDQVYERAIGAMDNALRVFDHANLLSQALRRNQDTSTNLTNNALDQERDFRNRLIEIFGYPYADDIGPTGTYASGYDGPDLYHYMYVDASELTGDEAPLPELSGEFEAFFIPMDNGVGFDLPSIEGLDSALQPQSQAIRVVRYHFDLNGPGIFAKPPSWVGQRRAPGEIQMAISDLLQNRARFEKSTIEHDKLLRKIEDAVELLEAQHNLHAREIQLKNNKRNWVVTLNLAILAAKTTAAVLKEKAETTEKLKDATAECFPKSVGTSTDATAPARCAVKFSYTAVSGGINVGAQVAEFIANGAELTKDVVDAQTDLELEVASNTFEVIQRVNELEQLVREEAGLRLEMYTTEEVTRQSVGKYLVALAKGERTLEDLITFRKRAAAETQTHRYQDMAFRVFRNDALQKYRAQFDLAARYAYLAATAYDYETSLIGSSGGAGRRFLTDIVRHRGLGQVIDGVPIAGSRGLADPLARMRQNFNVLRGQFGFNNPQTETNRFSLRAELFRLPDSADAEWRDELERYRVADLWQVPEFRRMARSFAPESAGPQPGLVIPFDTTVTFGLNYFGWPLGGGDSAYDSSHFATKVRSVGLWFEGYSGAGLSQTPRVYLLPAGADVLRAPNAGDFETREWRVVDQKLPVPFPIGAIDLGDPDWIPLHDSLNEDLGGIRRISSFRAYHDSGGFDPSETTTESRLIGRSVWNTKWMLIIPGGTLLANPNQGLDTFIHGQDGGGGISDILLFFQTYAYSGNVAANAEVDTVLFGAEDDNQSGWVADHD